MEPGSEAANSKLAVLCEVGVAGPLTTSVSGGAVSTVQVYSAGVGSTLPAASTARTISMCSPSTRPVNVTGLVQGAKLLPSRLHS